MSLKHRVAWRSTTDRTCHGIWYSDYDFIKNWVDELNQEYPYIEHWVESKEFDEKEKP
jgi:hypothetical protein